MSYHPDDLTMAVIDHLIGNMAELLPMKRSVEPTSALLDGSALERRQRREARRAMSAVVRALPVSRAVVVREVAA